MDVLTEELPAWRHRLHQMRDIVAAGMNRKDKPALRIAEERAPYGNPNGEASG